MKVSVETTKGSTDHLLYQRQRIAASNSKPMPDVVSSSATSPQDRLLSLLRKNFQPLYAILDAARDTKVLAALLQSKSHYQSLYQGAEGARLAQFAPYLVRLPDDSSFLEMLVREGWGKSWGVYLTCASEFSEVRRHVRHFLEVTLPDGRDVYFRFYDPRVLRVYLSTCTPEDTKEFFGPIGAYLVEDTDPTKLLRFVDTGKGCPGVVIELHDPDEHSHRSERKGSSKTTL
jgi:hypothetical protein